MNVGYLFPIWGSVVHFQQFNASFFKGRSYPSVALVKASWAGIGALRHPEVDPFWGHLVELGPRSLTNRSNTSPKANPVTRGFWRQNRVRGGRSGCTRRKLYCSRPAPCSTARVLLSIGNGG